MISPISIRYAKALFSKIDESLDTENKKNLFQSVLEDLQRVSTAFKSDLNIEHFIQSPFISRDIKKNILEKTFKGKVNDITLDFLFLLNVKKRLSSLNDIAHAFQKSLDYYQGIRRGFVRSSHPLDEKEKSNLLMNLEKIIKYKIVLEYIEDKDLLGGIQAEVEGWTFEDNIKSHLKRLKEELNRSKN